MLWVISMLGSANERLNRLNLISARCDAQDITSSGGFWRLTYTDKHFRVLYANTGNVFVLVR